MLSRYYVAGFVGLFLLTTFLPTSCDPDYVGGSPTADVDGKVFLDGQPIEDAKVVFIPFKSFSVAGREKNISYGTTDAQGNFKLKKANGDFGAAKGLHRVIISKRTTPVDSAVKTENPLEDLLPAAGQDLFLLSSEGELFPMIYNRQSTLTFDVDTSLKTVRANFDLSSVDPLLLDD